MQIANGSKTSYSNQYLKKCERERGKKSKQEKKRMNRMGRKLIKFKLNLAIFYSVFWSF